MKKTNIFYFLFAASVATSITFSSCGGGGGDTDLPDLTPEVIDANITSSRTLTNRSSGIDYTIDGCLEVDGATLTIEPGVKIQFTQNSCLNMMNFGALKAVGTATEPIIFTGVQATKGFWEGLYFGTSNNTDNELTYCTVEYAGEAAAYSTTIKAAIVIGTFWDNPARLKMNHVTVQHNNNSGVYVHKNSYLTPFKNCIITDNDTPVKAMEEGVQYLDNENTFTGNAHDRIEWAIYGGGAIDAAVTVKALSVPYYLSSTQYNATTQGIITVEAGTHFLMSQNSHISAYDGGSVVMNGTVSNKIIIEGLQSTPGFWEGVESIYDGSSLTMNHVNVSDGGDVASGSNAMISHNFNGALNITNCTFSNHSEYALSYYVVDIHNADIETSNVCIGSSGFGCFHQR